MITVITVEDILVVTLRYHVIKTVTMFYLSGLKVNLYYTNKKSDEDEK